MNDCIGSKEHTNPQVLHSKVPPLSSKETLVKGTHVDDSDGDEL